jgi:hypothetical protein
VIASTAAFFTLFGFINLRVERIFPIEDLVVQSADRITDVIVRSTRYEMLRNDRDALYNVIQEVGSEPGIQRIRIFNKDGRSSFPPSREVDRRWTRPPKPATAATRNRRRWRSKLNRRDRARIFHRQAGPSPAGRDPPIANAPECSAHPATCTTPASGAGGHRRHAVAGPVDAQMARTRPTSVVPGGRDRCSAAGGGGCSCGWWSTGRSRN